MFIHKPYAFLAIKRIKQIQILGQVKIIVKSDTRDQDLKLLKVQSSLVSNRYDIKRFKKEGFSKRSIRTSETVEFEENATELSSKRSVRKHAQAQRMSNTRVVLEG